jgi:hypothetical protein
VTSQNVVADAAAEAIAASLKDGSLNKVIVNNDEYSMTYTGATNAGVDADEKTSVWSMQDGTESRPLTHKLSEVLRKRNPDGSPKFWMPGMPGKPPDQKLGVLPCKLYADHDDREWLDSIGLIGRYCEKATLRSEFDVETHMLNRHPQENALIQNALERRQREEERELQQLQLQALRSAVPTENRGKRSAGKTEE